MSADAAVAAERPGGSGAVTDGDGADEQDPVTARAFEIWSQTVMAGKPDKHVRESFADAFVNWDSPLHPKVWKYALGEVRSTRAIEAATVGRDGTDGSEGVTKETVQATTAALRVFDELVELREELRRRAQGGTEAGPTAAGPGQHELDVASAMAERALEQGPAAAGLIGEFVGEQVALRVKVESLSPESARAVGITGKGSVAAVTGAAGEGRRVDRVDAGLLELVQFRAETLLRSAGIGLAPVRGVRQVPAPAVINASLAMVLRAAGVPGIELSEHGELLCEALGSDGDLARTATIDARLGALGRRLDDLTALSRRSHERVIAIDTSSKLTNMALAFTVAEDLKVVRVGLGAEALEKIDIADPAVLGLLAKMAEQSGAESRRRADAQGRPSKSAAQARKDATG